MASNKLFPASPNRLMPDTLDDGSPDPNATEGWQQLYRNLTSPTDWGGVGRGYANALLAGTISPGQVMGPALEGAAMRRVLTQAERRGFKNPRSPSDAKYILQDGRTLGSGDEEHQYIANQLGYGIGEDGVQRMMQDTGAVRVNVAADLFDGSGDVSIHHPPTDQQMLQLSRYFKGRDGPTNVSYGQDGFWTVQNAGELSRLLRQAQEAPQ